MTYPSNLYARETWEIQIFILWGGGDLDRLLWFSGKDWEAYVLSVLHHAFITELNGVSKLVLWDFSQLSWQIMCFSKVSGGLWEAYILIVQSISLNIVYSYSECYFVRCRHGWCSAKSEAVI